MGATARHGIKRSKVRSCPPRRPPPRPPPRARDHRQPAVCSLDGVFMRVARPCVQHLSDRQLKPGRAHPRPAGARPQPPPPTPPFSRSSSTSRKLGISCTPSAPRVLWNLVWMEQPSGEEDPLWCALLFVPCTAPICSCSMIDACVDGAAVLLPVYLWMDDLGFQHQVIHLPLSSLPWRWWQVYDRATVAAMSFFSSFMF